MDPPHDGDSSTLSEQPRIHSDTEKSPDPIAESAAPTVESRPSEIPYRLYKRRFVGLIGLIILNITSAVSGSWFGPISNTMAAEFGITLDQVNWLGNIGAVIYMPAAILVPIIVTRYGSRRCCDVGAVTLLLSAWIRYAGIIPSLPINGAYILLFLGQALGSVAQAIFEILAPSYSEAWFDLNGRTTATMLIAICCFSSS